MRYITIALILSVLWATPSLARVNQLAVETNWVYPLTQGRMIYEQREMGIYTYDYGVNRPKLWKPRYDAEKFGWGKLSESCAFAVSPNGKWSAVAYLAQPKPIPGQNETETVALIMLVDDTQLGRMVGLCRIDQGPVLLKFTSDSRRLVMAPTLPCELTAVAARTCLSGRTASGKNKRYDYYDVKSARRGALEGFEHRANFCADPNSDLVLCASGDDVPDGELDFVNVLTGATVASYKPGCSGGDIWLNGWVSKKDVLVTIGAGSSARRQGLLSTNGSFKAAPKPIWDVRCLLDNGTCVFSDDGGKTLKHGDVDWPGFTVRGAKKLRSFGDPMKLSVCGMKGSGALLVYCGGDGTLWLLRGNDIYE
jgi:hypothetical protein